MDILLLLLSLEGKVFVTGSVSFIVSVPCGVSLPVKLFFSSNYYILDLLNLSLNLEIYQSSKFIYFQINWH